MSSTKSIFDNAKRKIQIEQTVRRFLQLLDENELDLEDGLVAWNMLGFTIFQDTYPEENHDEIQQRMADFSKNLFDSGKLS
jgi:proline dehydrogenase